MGSFLYIFPRFHSEAQGSRRAARWMTGGSSVEEKKMKKKKRMMKIYLKSRFRVCWLVRLSMVPS